MLFQKWAIFQTTAFLSDNLLVTPSESIAVRIPFQNIPHSQSSLDQPESWKTSFNIREGREAWAHKLHFQPFGVGICSLGFPFPEGRILTSNTEEFWSENSVLSVQIVVCLSSERLTCLLGMRRIIKLYSQTNYIWPRFQLLLFNWHFQHQGVNLGSAAEGFTVTALGSNGNRGIKPLWFGKFIS